MVDLLVKLILQKDTDALLLKSLPTKFKLPKMRFDALKQSEEQMLATKQAQRKKRPVPIEEDLLRVKPTPARKEKPPKVITTRPKATIREEYDSEDSSEMQPIARRGSGREALYDSWFPSSPRTNHRFPV